MRFSEPLAQFRAEEMPSLARGTRKAYEDSFGPIEDYFVENQEDAELG